MTLHYYPPKAHDFVHKVLFLPHPTSIRTWAASVECESGFFCDMINLIEATAQIKSYLSDVILITYAMAKNKGTWWDPKKKCYVGRVNYCTGLSEAEDALATEALVFTICPITGHWKHQIAYFIQNKIQHQSKHSLSKIVLACCTQKSTCLLHWLLMVHTLIKAQQHSLALNRDLKHSNVLSLFMDPNHEDICHLQ